MGQKSTYSDRILELFYEEPGKRFTVRDLAKKTKIPKSTVHKYLSQLKKQDLITKDNEAATTDFFKVKKTNYYIEKFYTIGLIDFLTDSLNPSCIILFGSFRKGESVRESDIDIFIETTKKTPPNLSKFEKKLGHEIHLFLEKDIKKLPDRLLNNVINGVKLEGYFKIR